MSENENEQIYELFTRHKRGDELIHRGSVTASTDQLAKLYATKTYDEEGWVEMFLVRREHMINIREPEGLFEESSEAHV